MTDKNSRTVTCTLAEGQEEERYEQIRPVLVDTYEGADEQESGCTLRFTGVDETVMAVAKFVALERQCCSFAEYQMKVTPPYSETHLTITGPEGTKELFFEGLVDLLETESAEGV